jgi:hypothetical protein
VQADADSVNAASWNDDIRSEAARSGLGRVGSRRCAVCADETNEDSAGAESAAAV